MRKILKLITAAATVFAVLFASVISFSAETYYNYDNYLYRDVDYYADTIAFCGSTDNADALVIPDQIGVKTVVEIDEYAFYNNNVIKEIDLSQTEHLYKIGTAAFRGCSELETLEIPGTVRYLAEFMLTDCTSLKTLLIETTSTIIPDEMCNRCSALETFEVPESVNRICRYAFGSCTSLNYVKIPRGVTEIDPSAFYDCPNLTLGVYYGSYAQQYAIDNNIPYTLLDGVQLGDVDGINGVNINDVTAIQSYLAELNVLEGIYLHAADVNQDEVVDISDATAIQMYLAGYNLPYPIGEVMTQ